MELKNYIQVFENTNDIKLISSFIKYLNNQKFQTATIIQDENSPSVVNTETRRVQALHIGKEQNNLSQTHWSNYWGSFFNFFLEEYEKKLNLKTSSTRITTIEALKYEEGGFYKPHTDYHLKFPRNISIIYFLNNDYEGGELHFYNPSNLNEKFLSIKPSCGKLIMWPSNFLYPHAVSSVKKGTRYVLVSWIS